MTENRARRAPRTHAVRPRWAWIALPVLVLGLLLVGWGIVVESWAWAGAGLVVLVAGGLLARYGGFFHDVQGNASASAQRHDVVEGNEHEFPGAGTTRSEGEVKREVRRRRLGHHG